MTANILNRREFLRLSSGGAAALLFSVGGMSCRGRETPPNILIIVSDDQRHDTIRALGNPHIITPHLDGLAEKGTSFRNAYIMGGTSGAVCIPSRAMLMTGRSLFQLEGVGGSIPGDHTMLPELFRLDGYNSFGIGKWHNGREAYARSFGGGAEIMFGGMSDHWNVPVYGFDPEGRYEARTPVIPNPGSSNEVKYRNYEAITDGKHSSELFADAAVDFLDSQGASSPWLLYLALTAPHDPRSMPDEYLQKYDIEDIPLPRNFMAEHPFDNGELEVRDELLAGFPRSPEEVRRHILEYYAMITHMDAQIGRVLEALKKTGQAENTIIVFVGDNGLALGQHGLMGKQNVYDHSVHVPLIVAGPGIPRGETRDGLCYHLDIFPTLCRLTERPVPGSVWGKSLVPHIRQEAGSHREALYFSYKNFQRALMTDRWKLILYNVAGEKHVQLFDKRDDPGETKNLAGDPGRADLIAQLTAKLGEMMKEAGDPVLLEAPIWSLG